MKLFLIDGNSFCYRAFYAIKALATSSGEPTNAVYGFIAMMRKLIKDECPDYLGIAFDLKGPTFRHKKYERYKIHRKPMPEELVTQMPVIKDMVRAYNIPIFEKQGYEADDVLATIAVKLAGAGLDVYIVTGDKDALQLVGPHIKIYSTHKEGLIYDAKSVKERYGVRPEQMTDLIALMGDASDNIKGVPGFGEKTAVSLMSRFKGLEDMLSRPDEIKQESKKALLVRHAEDARMSKDLATLDKDVPLKIDLEDLKLKAPDSEALVELFKRLEFKNLIREYAPRRHLGSKYHMVDDEEGFEDLIKKLKKSGLFVLDFETTSPDPMIARPIGISFSFREGEAHYVVFKNSSGGALFEGDKRGLEAKWALGRLKGVLEDAAVKKAGQNIKYEYIILRNHGIAPKGIYFDTMIASYLLNPSKLNHNLDDISLEYLEYKKIPLSDLIGSGKKKTGLEEAAVEKVCEYSCEDSDVTFRLMKIFEKMLKEKNLYELFIDVEMPLVAVLAEMELAGVGLDVKLLKEMSEKTAARLKLLTKDIWDMAGGEFNINSHQQLSNVLFEKLKLPVIKRTKTGISTDEGVLRKLETAHPIIGLMLEYRMLAKLASTYIDALPGLINKKTGRVHTSFNQTVTATGRLSSSSPNLQNIPVKTEIGRQIRRAFIPSRKEDTLIAADYSQIELRILAHFSNDKNLITAFKKGKDVHTYTAALIFGVKEDEVTKKMRQQAKTVNFGIVYGMSPYGLSRDLGIDVSAAEEFIENYFERYPGVRLYLEDQIESARDERCVTTILNRRRYIPDIDSANVKMRQFSERTAINTPIQGSAADLIKIAMLDIARTVEAEGLKSRMILQLHDELVFEVKKGESARMRRLIKEKMEGAFKLRIPVLVRMGEGKNWLEAEGE